MPEEPLESFDCTVVGEDGSQLTVHAVSSSGDESIIKLDLTGFPPGWRHAGARFTVDSLLRDRSRYSFVTKGRAIRPWAKTDSPSVLRASDPGLASWLTELFQGELPAAVRVEVLGGSSSALRLSFSTLGFNVTIMSEGAGGVLTGTARPRSPRPGEPDRYVLGMGKHGRDTWREILGRILALDSARQLSFLPPGP